MPTVLPEGLHLSTFLEREDPRDAFVGRTSKRFLDLPQGAVVGSSSLRRQAMIKRLRPDLQVVMFRGNVQTRLRKLEEGEVDGTFLACAGLKRLDLADVITDLLDPAVFCQRRDRVQSALKAALAMKNRCTAQAIGSSRNACSSCL